MAETLTQELDRLTAAAIRDPLGESRDDHLRRILLMNPGKHYATASEWVGRRPLYTSPPAADELHDPEGFEDYSHSGSQHGGENGSVVMTSSSAKPSNGYDAESSKLAAVEVVKYGDSFAGDVPDGHGGFKYVELTLPVGVHEYTPEAGAGGAITAGIIRALPDSRFDGISLVSAPSLATLGGIAATGAIGSSGTARATGATGSPLAKLAGLGLFGYCAWRWLK